MIYVGKILIRPKNKAQNHKMKNQPKLFRRIWRRQMATTTTMTTAVASVAAMAAVAAVATLAAHWMNGMFIEIAEEEKEGERNDFLLYKYTWTSSVESSNSSKPFLSLIEIFLVWN